MNKSDILNYCKEMQSNNSSYTEVHARNIVGRAYYYTYYSLEENIKNRLNWQETETKGGVHAKMISRLKDSNITNTNKKKALELYSEINRFKRMRVKADYKLEQPIRSADANYWIRRAEDLSQLLDTL